MGRLEWVESGGRAGRKERSGSIGEAAAMVDVEARRRGARRWEWDFFIFIFFYIFLGGVWPCGGIGMP